jgi:hypothetical protein
MCLRIFTPKGGAVMYSQRVVRYSKKETVSQSYEILSNNLVEHRIHSLKKSSSKQEFFNLLLTQQVANNIR